ncbi:hypothetical protein HPB48_009096 [Haemaphysalis longicornis]|uniref:Reverse transcriptase domain-containing protein n=1 Tax=Haemaphysalis longicornis TaxID=44386 RepID=A0A9J6GRU7_HAELO|nr:hypothetical protein HPB48_009096 [Haemaphysalis longicornis]
MPTIRNGDLSPDTISTPIDGTPQAAVQTPALFNITMMTLPSKLYEIEDILHYCYAKDITI